MVRILPVAAALTAFLTFGVRFALSRGPGVRLSTSAQAMFMKIAGICLSRRAGPTSWPAIAASAM
jgi:hypothetical protein